MGERDPSVAWLDGGFVEWADARIHVDTHAVLGGLNAYEVIAGFWSAEQSQLHLFRVREHLERLEQSAHVMRLPPHGVPPPELGRVACELVARNGYEQDVLVRIAHYLGSGALFSYRPEEISSGVFVTAKPAVADPPTRRGIHIATSRWARLADLAAPPRVKCGANYQNARLAQIQAQADGYDDAVLLNAAGKLSELPLANIFIVRGDVLITPGVTSGILEGITRRSILELAPELAVDVEQREIDRSELYVADEAFACGTGREVWPILSADRYQLGAGEVGPVTQKIQAHLDGIIRGQSTRGEWLTPVYPAGDRDREREARVSR
jgi:branched-chain amino acid aminotransferase